MLLPATLDPPPPDPPSPAPEGVAEGLSAKDRCRLVDAQSALDDVDSLGRFRTCLDREVQRVFPHGMVACDIASAGPRGEWEPPLLHRFPAECFDRLRGALTERWLINRRPLMLALDDPSAAWTAAWLPGLWPFKLQNLAWHALFDPGRRME